MKLRAVSARRISVKKDESTSIERQEEVITARIGRENLDLVGEAVDVNVSASKVDPFKRPKLGVWLNERAGDFDVLLFWRIDRAVRSMSDLHALMKWAREHQKRIIFCEGPGSEYDFDFTGRGDDSKQELALLLATVIAWASRIESLATSERVKSSHDYLRREGEWGGGMIPYGLKPQRKKGAKRGWELVHNPETLPILLDIIDRVIAGERLLPICKDLNDAAVPTPRDYWLKKKEQDRADEERSTSSDPRSPRKWSTQGLKVILTSRVLLGEWVVDGTLNVDKDGELIQRCEPIISQSKWNDLQAALTALSMDAKNKYSEANPLLGVATCARCGRPYYLKQEKQKGRIYSNLSCRSRHGDQFTSCGQSTISLKYALEIVDELTMTMIGGFEAKRRIFVPGDDRSEELARLNARIADLEDEYDEGKDDDRERYLERKNKLKSKIAAIGPDPVKPAKYEWVGTGKTYGDTWLTLNSEARLKLLRDLGIKVFIGRGDSSAAEVAYSTIADEKTATPWSTRTALVLDEATSNTMLSNSQDGTRVKKDLRVWYLQSGEVPFHELAAQLT